MNSVGKAAKYEDSVDGQLQIDVEQYASLVKRISQHMLARMPSCVQLEDLQQAGMVGLLEAARKYDPSQGASFETYAGIRIRGAIVDEIRRGDWAPRSVYRNSRRIAEVINQLENQFGREATEQEIAEALSVSAEEYRKMRQDTLCTKLFSLDEHYGDEEYTLEIPDEGSTFNTPHEDLQQASLKQRLIDSIKSLPERDQLVLALYYDEELNLKEIGAVLGVSESRVSQIHSQAAMRLRAKMVDWVAD